MQDNRDLFKFMKPESNDSLLKMNGSDLQDLIYYLNHFYLSLRDKLGINRKITFGMELEFEEANKDSIKNELIRNNLDDDWKVKGDGSLSNGAEIASPILHDIKVNWENLSRVCKILNKYSVIGEKAGSHIHIGAPILGPNKQSWVNFLKLWSIYENIIFRFVYGDFLTDRPSLKKYAPPMKRAFYEAYSLFAEDDDDFTTYDILEKIRDEKYQAVNFQHVSSFDRSCDRNTIEFRCPNGTLDPVVWQNNLNLFVRLLTYAKSTSFNNEVIDERQQFNDSLNIDLGDYNKIYLSQALELADLIFFNNLDKIYFLRQYLKSYDISDKSLMKTKPFTKTFI